MQNPHELWKSTKNLYSTYLNPPAAVDYADRGSLTDAESTLASRMLAIDSQIEKLEIFLENQDKPPTAESIAQLFHRFPWISGLAAVDNLGDVHAQEPAVSMKPLDFAPILDQESRKGSPRGLRAFAQDTPFGAEIYMGMPIYEDAELRGFLVCHFDMRSLLQYVGSQGDLVILTPEAVLWSGNFVLDATPLANRNWEAITSDAIEGSFSDSTGEFVWMARFLGRMPMIFAAPVRGNYDSGSVPDLKDSEAASESDKQHETQPEDSLNAVDSAGQIQQEETSSDLFTTPPALRPNSGIFRIDADTNSGEEQK